MTPRDERRQARTARRRLQWLAPARVSAWRASSAVALAAALAGCGTGAPMRYFTLEAVAPALGAGAAAAARPAPYDGPPLQVRSVQLPPALDRPELVREVAPDQFEILEFDHWGAPLGRLARQALTEDLATRLPPGRLVFPGASWPEPGADLSVDILSFKVADGVASMVLSWTVRASAMTGAAPAASAAAPRTALGAHLRLQTPAGNGTGATARAFGELLAQVADSVVAELARAPR